MLLETVRGLKNIPENARTLSEEAAIKHQNKFINKWKNRSEVFLLTYGHWIASSATAISSIFIVKHFRQQFKLKNVGRYSTYLPTAALPSAVTFMTYKRKVTDNILIMKMTCPLCMQLKYGIQHMLSTIVYTTLFACTTCYGVASSRNICYIPNPQVDGKEFLKFMYTRIKKFGMKYHVLAASQLVIILLLPYLQSQELSNIILKMQSQHSKDDMYL